MEECRGTYPLWTPLTHRMLTGLYYRAGNDSNILELHSDGVLIMNDTIFQASDKSMQFCLNQMIFTTIKQLFFFTILLKQKSLKISSSTSFAVIHFFQVLVIFSLLSLPVLPVFGLEQ